MNDWNDMRYLILSTLFIWAKRLPGLHHYDYRTAPLHLLGIKTLEAFRLVADLLYVYKIVFGYIDITALLNFLMYLVLIIAQDWDNIYKIYTNYFCINVKKQGIFVIVL